MLTHKSSRNKNDDMMEDHYNQNDQSNVSFYSEPTIDYKDSKLKTHFSFLTLFTYFLVLESN